MRKGPPRRYYPTDPVQWIRARRGNARSVQHVVADMQLNRDFATPTLCRKEVGDGSMPRYDGRGPLGPKTKPPKVTKHPSPNYPICPLCEKALASIKAEGQEPKPTTTWKPGMPIEQPARGSRLFHPEVSALRSKEMMRRIDMTNRRVVAIFKAECWERYQQIRAEVDEERGLLPGDDEWWERAKAHKWPSYVPGKGWVS